MSVKAGIPIRGKPGGGPDKEDTPPREVLVVVVPEDAIDA